MKLIALAVLVAALAVPTALAGTDGPGFTITLKQGGKTVKTLKAGTYTITVQDKSNIHNFHLTGPGVNRKTSVGGTGTTKWTLTLRKGTYLFVCDPHKTSMKGSFMVKAP